MKQQLRQLTLIGAYLTALQGCGAVGEKVSSSATLTNQAVQEIKVNQLGYAPDRSKVAIIPGSAADFSVINTATLKPVFSGKSTGAKYWKLADETASMADFSQVHQPGEYRIRSASGQFSPPFYIGSSLLEDAHDAAIKAYYFNRASTALDPAFASVWQRKAGHPDTNVIPLNAEARISQKAFSSSKGWYDAGDYNKYVVNSGISTYTLMRTYLDFPRFYQQRQLNIPESTNGVPDILDEVKWNLDWLLTMQDTDGGVNHKLTTKYFAGAVMPAEATAQRVVTGKSTAATLNFAAVMAVASRLPYENPQQYQQAAKLAWQWAQQNPQRIYHNESDIHTGEYGDDDVSDEFAWAAAELYLTTGQAQYLQAFLDYQGDPVTPGWSNVALLGTISLLKDSENLDANKRNQLQTHLLSLANKLIDEADNSAYGVAMAAKDFVWGSNGVAMNNAMVLWQAWQLTQEDKFRQAAIRLNDYVLGLNPTGYSYVTGFGSRQPMNIHHRQSRADDQLNPVPGFLVGGPHAGQQDGCNYPSAVPARSYIDDWCSYATNEVTINWNAPLVYSLAAQITQDH
ncbi:cellulase [Alteromonas pelagimontana]|uniref:Endoglucanase n=1 Tax=Alteromonas pelagimontana TaxID=1858656 RepID=A0A6M4MDQ5_9ALTE|nr:glycoside hydrolase family 9 protein [Alteromonas pelagimontana]QJR81321.1 cellulase [Alteromonas pelagimontana]